MSNRTKWLSGLMLAALFTAGSCQKGRKGEGTAGGNVVKVKTETVSASAAEDRLGYTGTIEEMSGTTLSFAGAGTVRLLAVSEGQSVSKGQLIGEIDATSNTNALVMAKAAAGQARDALSQAQDAYRRMKQLHDSGSLPEMKWVEVETRLSQAQQMVHQAEASEQIARKGLADTRLRAPFGGYIAAKMAEAGQNVMPGVPVVKLVTIDRVKVKLSVPEAEIGRIALGAAVRFKVPSMGSEEFTGKIAEKGVAADPLSRSYEVKAVADNRAHRLLPGMVCDVSVVSPGSAASVSLPANIVQIDTDNRPFVWTLSGGKARKAMITVGGYAGDRILVSSGLRAGDKVIVEGQQKVSNGMEVSE